MSSARPTSASAFSISLMQRSAFYIRSGTGPIEATTYTAPSFAREDCVGGRRPEVIGGGSGVGGGEGTGRGEQGERSGDGR